MKQMVYVDMDIVLIDLPPSPTLRVVRSSRGKSFEWSSAATCNFADPVQRFRAHSSSHHRLVDDATRRSTALTTQSAKDYLRLRTQNEPTNS